MSLADNLKYLRKERGLSQEDLAEDLKVSRQAIGKWESGADPETSHLKNISIHFNVDLQTLVFGDVRNMPGNLTVSSDIKISMDTHAPENNHAVSQPPAKDFSRQFRAIRTVAAIILILMGPFWPSRIPYDIRTSLMFFGFFIGVGLLIFNRITGKKDGRKPADPTIMESDRDEKDA